MKPSARVLIVDDSRVLRAHLRTMMQTMGWSCDEADSGVTALDRMAGSPDFDLILLDVNMPRMSGMECLRAICNLPNRPPTKIMMVTTESDFPVVTEALTQGSDEFLMKPFTRESLISKLTLMELPVGL